MSTLQDEILTNIARQMSDEIEAELLWNVVNNDRYKFTYPTVSSLFAEQLAWANNTFGEDDARWAYNRLCFYFKEQKDYNWFVLKWSCE
jgi:hypothetical protein